MDESVIKKTKKDKNNVGIGKEKGDDSGDDSEDYMIKLEELEANIKLEDLIAKLSEETAGSPVKGSTKSRNGSVKGAKNSLKKKSAYAAIMEEVQSIMPKKRPPTISTYNLRHSSSQQEDSNSIIPKKNIFRKPKT